MARIVATLVILVKICSIVIVTGLEWQTTPDDYVYACVGSDVTLPWQFKATENETVVSVNWIHDGSLSSSMVATLAHRHFVPTAGYTARVRHVQNGGLVLEDLFTEDSGNYTVEVNVAVTGGLFRSFRRTVHVQVAAGLMLKGGLTAEQDPEAWWDETSRQWFMRLTCGAFTFLGPPPVDLVWTTPGGKTKPSSGYASGQFYLSLATPVQGGNYTCSIPLVRLPDLCYKEQGGHDISALSSTVIVDEMKGRLSLMEANQKTLREDRERLLTNQKTLQEKLQRVEQTHVQDMQNVTEYFQGMLDDLMDKVEFLYNNTELKQQQDKLVEEAANTGPCRSSFHTVLDDAWRSTSEGQSRLQCDKDLEPGWYRFLLNGEKAVMPTTCVPVNHCHTHAPQWLDLQGNSLPAVGEAVEGRACAHWSSDCCHWQSPVVVHNCGAFFVYNLRPGSDCHLAYCVERQE